MYRVQLLFLVVLSFPTLLQSQCHDLNLTLSVRASSTSYPLFDNIQLEIQLSNTGEVPLLFSRELGWGVGRTEIRVFDSNREQVSTDFLADEVPPPPARQDFLQLNPNEFFGVRLTEQATHFVNKPGEYEFVVEYTSGISDAGLKST